MILAIALAANAQNTALLRFIERLTQPYPGDRIATVTRPNQGIRQSAKNALLFAIVATIAPLLTAHLLGNTYRAFWAASGLSFGLALGGGAAFIKHGILRFVLACQGLVPRNYARFLDCAAERIFLPKVGGGYIFVDRLLLEHFAKGTPTGDRPSYPPRLGYNKLSDSLPHGFYEVFAGRRR